MSEPSSEAKPSEVVILALQFDVDDPKGTLWFKVPAQVITPEQMARLKSKQGESAFESRIKPNGRMIAPMGGMGGAPARLETEYYDPTGFFDALLRYQERAKPEDTIPFGKTGYSFKFSYEFSSEKLLEENEFVKFFAEYQG